MNGEGRVAGRVADYLLARRGLLTRRWLRAVRQQMQVCPDTREAVAGLINQLPGLFAELCALLGGARGDDEVAMRAAHDARAHANERWRQGFALDELYLELYLLQRCVHACVREYFASAPSREGQTATHEMIEQFFGEAIRGAIGQFQSQQDRRVTEALAKRDVALARQHRSDERLRMAAEAAGLGIFEWEPDTDAAVWENERMYALTGQAVENGALSAGEFIAQIVHPDDAPKLQEQLEASIASSKDFHAQFRIRRVCDGKTRVLEAWGRLVPGIDGTRSVLVGTLADVTQRVSDEEAARTADRRKDVFLATLAHELRNPLAPILNAAHLLRRSDASPHELRWLQGVIDRHGRHLAHLIDDLLDVSRITAGKIALRKEVFDVQTAVDRAIEMNAPAAAQRGHRLDVTGVHGSSLFVYGDITRVTQVLSNLLDNAVKYTADGGHIRLAAAETGATVTITVEDDGIGMEPELIPSLFRLFEQAVESAAARKAGLGIGLSVAKSLVEMHGGTISASSQGHGRGSQFTLCLPLSDAPDIKEKSEIVSAAVPVEARRVLIVDDNEDAALSLAKVLDDHEVRTAGSGAQALRVAREFHPMVVFLDLALPDMSGFEVAQQLRQQDTGREITLVALTGYGQPEDRQRTRDAGFDHHVVKPARLEEIMRILARG
ncbi:ATP-binding protein [Paraburkholderia sabiae]|uniref:histidine kinase n=1 Tax=Paraburkholderia sabiae TaxID=273251 RepID=A0ABU9QM74_9BURK|nr:PAS domain-containing hybrid sensor histidine kinase/response regulator [Paraburkholderia sabiae]WJZ79962.1 ATP-binding protein [Paraburkholderia sabiae]CAD6561263.1 Sensor histidine kinase RcsC [Paraburkholderia sabiae]